MLSIGQGVRPKDLITEWAESLLQRTQGHSGLVDAYDVYDILLNYWAETMQDDCYMIANDGWTYPEVKAVKRKETTDKKTKKTTVKESACMYDEIVCDLLPVNILLAEYFTTETNEINDILVQVEGKQSEMDELVEQNQDVFNFNDNDEEAENEDKTLSVKAADVKKAIKNAKNENTSEDDIKILKEWLALSDKKDKLNKLLKQKRSELTDAVVAKYAALTGDDIKMLVVDRKWLASIICSSEALMQSVTHRIATDVAALAERYETTLSDLAQNVSSYEDEVNGYLKEMGFTI